MRNKITTTASFIAVAFLALCLAGVIAYAVPSSPAALNVVQTSTRDLSSQPAQSANAQGGNVTEININALTITKSWQGYYGNISGTITLQNALNETFYNWSMSNMRGRVFATRTNSITWTAVGCATLQNITNEEVVLNQSATDSDSVRNTFSKTTHPAINVSTSEIAANTCNVTNGYVNNNSQNSNYQMFLLAQGTNIIYATIMNRTTVGFDGKQHDFELLVGENEKTGYTGVTTYYFWTEFD